MQDNKNIRDNEEQEYNNLPDAGKNLRFDVPDGYFDEFPNKIQQRIEVKKPDNTFYNWVKLKYSLPLAAALIIGIMLLSTYTGSDRNNDYQFDEYGNRVSFDIYLQGD